MAPSRGVPRVITRLEALLQLRVRNEEAPPSKASPPCVVDRSRKAKRLPCVPQLTTMASARPSVQTAIAYGATTRPFPTPRKPREATRPHLTRLATDRRLSLRDAK